jgi:hypothetical protein
MINLTICFMDPVRWRKETVALETYCSVSKRTEDILIKVAVISRKVGDLEECEVCLKPWGSLDEKYGFIETSLSRVIHGCISKFDSLSKGQGWSQKEDPFQISRVFCKESGVLEMSSILDILGILFE